MRLRIVAGYGALAAALGGACGGRADLGSVDGPVHDGGAPRSSAAEARATRDAGRALDASMTDDAAAMVTPSSDGADAAPDCQVAPRSPYAANADSCVTIDLSSYDRSCVTDSDCTAIAVGSHCNFGCAGACPNAAINVRDRACYEQALPLGSSNACECGNILAPDARCIHGVCMYCGHGGTCVVPGSGGAPNRAPSFFGG